jgi:hypothetical protein
MHGTKRELVLLYFEGIDHKLPHELWFLCLEISGLVRVVGRTNTLWWEIHIPRFVFSKDLDKWSRKNQPG